MASVLSLTTTTSGLSIDTAMYPNEYKKITWKLQMSKQNEQKERKKNTCSQTSRLETPEELQLHHNHEKFLFLTVMLLFVHYKMHYW
jgi:hypothetical protein